MHTTKIWEAENPENHRRYKLLLENDLFNGWHVYRYWWSRRRQRAGSKHHYYETQAEAEVLFEQLIKRKSKRGYIKPLNVLGTNY
jgi:predicted DNA-binding WGR domain protein